LNGLILAAACSDADDIVRRLHGRSRYAMPLANRALVRYAAEALVAAGVRDIAIAVSPSTISDVQGLISEQLSFGARLRYLETADAVTPLDTLIAARDLMDADRPLVVHSGDAFVMAGLGDAVADFNRGRPDVLLVSEASRTHPEASPVAIISPDALRELDRFSAHSSTIWGTIAALAEFGVRVADHALGGCWCYLGDADHLLEANRMILDELPHSAPEGELGSVRIEGRVVIHPSARLEMATVRGPAVIGGGAELVNTFVGPYTSIGSGARLEGAEIDHSIVLDGAIIRHPGHRLEASVIGAGAEISRDYGMPTAVRLQVGRRSTVMLG